MGCSKPTYSKGYALQKLSAKRTLTALSILEQRRRFSRSQPPLTPRRPELLSILPTDRGCRLQPNADATALVDIRTQRQFAGRHPRRSISVPSVATLTRRFADSAIVGVKRFSTASLQISPRDTRDRYLARRHPDAQALRGEGAQAERHARRRLAAEGDHDGTVTWRRITDAVLQL